MIHTHYYKRLAEKISPCHKQFFWIFITLIIIAAIHAIFPLLIQHILHAVFIEKNSATIQTCLLTITMLLIARSLADYSNRSQMTKIDHCLCSQLNTALFDWILSLPALQYRTLDTHHVTEVTLTQIKKLARLFVQTITVIVRDTLIIIGLILCLAWLDKEFALLIALLTPFIVIMQHVIQKHHNADLHLNTPVIVKLANRLQHLIENFRLIRLYGGQQQEYRRLTETLQSTQKIDKNRAHYSAFVIVLCQLITLLVIVATTYLMSQLVLRDQLTLDQIGAFVTATLLIIAPINRLASLPQLLQNIQKYLEQIFQVLDQPIVADHNSTTLSEAQGKLTFKHVSFSNQKSEKSVQYSIDLEIKPGETVAFVCPYQQTRSVLIDLVLGFQQPENGQILLDNVPLDAIKHTDLLLHFAMVSHEPVMLNDSVAGNIAYGSTEYAHEASITTATQNAGASTFVREMPNGLQTDISENSNNITRQQRQIIEITRGLLKNAPIVILDNIWLQPNQIALNTALETLIHQRTAIILTETLPMTRHTIDRIFLLDNGTITQQ